jgi:asparagine synthase (glutamine-hydrolysing)
MSGRPLFDDRETDFASMVAKHLEIPIGILEGGGCVPYAGWESQGFSLPEPHHDPFYSLFVEQFQMVRQSARVALSGDGGDDVLSTPAVHYLKYLLRRGRAGTLVKAFGGYFLRSGKFPPLRTGIRGRIRTWLRSRKEAPEYPKWLDPEFERANRLRERWSELQIEPKSEHPIHPKGYGALTSPFWPRMAEDEDAAWTGVPVESRAPFFDLRLMRFLLRLPPVPWCADKQLVRLAMKGILPEEVRRRPKSPTAQEPLDLYVMEEKWLPSREASSQSILKYVDWKKWKATPLNKTGSYLWTNLGPVSLDLWLNSVETKSRIE